MCIIHYQLKENITITTYLMPWTDKAVTTVLQGFHIVLFYKYAKHALDQIRGQLSESVADYFIFLNVHCITQINTTSK